MLFNSQSVTTKSKIDIDDNGFRELFPCYIKIISGFSKIDGGSGFKFLWSWTNALKYFWIIFYIGIPYRFWYDDDNEDNESGLNSTYNLWLD